MLQGLGRAHVKKTTKTEASECGIFEELSKYLTTAELGHDEAEAGRARS